MNGKWEEIFKDIQQSIAELGRLNPGVLAGKRALDNAGSKADLLGPKTRELIAIAVGVTTRCNECLARHVQEAVKLGASNEEIAEAVGVAVALNAGAAVVYAAKAIDAAITTDRNRAAQINTTL